MNPYAQTMLRTIYPLTLPRSMQAQIQANLDLMTTLALMPLVFLGEFSKAWQHEVFYK